MATGDRFAGFRIIRPLGAGGMGQVFLVEHPRLPRQEALKVLSPELSHDPDYRQRFAREADLAARLWHPHIVEVRDRGETGGQLWISMAYVDGEDAARQLARKYPAGMPAATVVPIVTAVASALDYAHGQGLLHRDVKPANIFISSPDSGGDTRVLLGDFGIARELVDAAGMTATNMTLGTVAYAAPEQLNGDVMDGRADQYALAATAHHLLTGTPLFPVTNPVAAISRHLTAPPPKLSASHPHLAPLDAVLAKALSKNPAERYPRCADFAEAFAAAAGGSTSAISPTAPTQQAPVPPPAAAPPPAPTPAPKRPRWILPAALASAAVLVAGLLVWKPWATNDMPSAPSDRAAPGSGERPAPSIAAVPPIGDPDLGLDIPISRPACDGSGIVVLDSAYTPGRYRDDVARALSNNPGASYLRTDLSCPSLRQKSDDGNPIYAVYRIAGTSKEQLCAAVTAAGPGTYGRWLDTISDPDVTVDCPKKSTSVEEAPAAVVDVDPASYMLWSGLYRFAYSISPFRECALHVPNGISASLWCETQFPPGTPQVSSDPPDGYEPVIGPPKTIRIEPPAGPEPSIAEGGPQKGRPMLPNHRITVGEFTCTTLPGNSVNCTAPTGEFRITNGVFTAEP